MSKVLEFIFVTFLLLVFAFGVFYYVKVSRSGLPKAEPGVDNAVVIVTTYPFQSLVIYPDGQKTGYDPVSRQVFIQIAKSKYYLQKAENSYTNDSYWLGLTDNPDEFTLQISGEADKYYSFGLYAYRHGQQLTQTFSGKIPTGGIATYQIKSVPKNNFPLEATLIK